ncbi:hypothetical protein FCV59_20540 [Vibrio sp. F13]|uniref:hypothetical protein n=1 Tax=Vibrio sp. F13 TaxID=2070777 RepID=UPI0010BD34A6|nr:hypothetical protein [Vibrio sp. F13]TKF69492.1 hypothetical protein FCV59_20540 [Vibrio sp. F13]
MLNDELNIFVVWNKAYNYIEEILELLSEELDLIEISEVNWKVGTFPNNLERFYGDSLKRVEKKVIECGEGPFKLIVVRDPNPIFSMRSTSSGHKIVNSKIFDLKAKCREITKAGHLVHSSDDEKEASFQYKLITGQSIRHELPSRFPQYGNIIGYDGWGSLEEVWPLLNAHCNYLVLRNFENLDRELNSLHPDIDLLVEDEKSVARLLGLRKRQENINRSQYYCKINGKEVNFDLRTPHDGYYPSNFSLELLKDKTLFKGFYIPNKTGYFWSLLYHAIFHKRFLSEDYVGRLHEKSKELDLDISEKCWDRLFCVNLIQSYLTENNWSSTEPNDQSVYYNYYDQYDINQRVSVKRRLRQQYYKILSQLKGKIRGIYGKFVRS